jgi:APA family basic amino acid/polyamine antiporter
MAQLEKALGLAGLTFYGVGIILGAGIYSVLGAAAEDAGAALWLCFAGAGLIALFSALAYAELSTTYPRASAEFTYLRHAFPSWPGVALVVGLLVALSGAATAATVAIAFAGYLQSFVDLSSPLAAPLVAWGLLLLVLALNVVGVKQSGWVNALFTLIEAGGLVVFIGLGMTTSSFGEGTGDALEAIPISGVAAGMALVFFSFLGFENIANLAEEAKQPEKHLPWAIFASLGFATLLYILVALAAVALMPPSELARSHAPLADAARASSPRVAGALGGIALFATANTALVSVLVAARVVFGVARKHNLPKILAAVLPGRKTPWAATVAVTVVAAALIPFGKVAVVASLSSFAGLLAFAAVNIALIVLRIREPDKERPFRVPGSIGRVPILPVIGVIATVGIATQLDRTALVTGVGVLAALSLYALLWLRFSRPASHLPSPAEPCR